jgi:hypothetical protein
MSHEDAVEEEAMAPFEGGSLEGLEFRAEKTHFSNHFGADEAGAEGDAPGGGLDCGRWIAIEHPRWLDEV